MSKQCRLCNIINNQAKVYGDVDNPFMIGEKYFSLVAIGAFVKGWTLLATKEHKFNLRYDYKNTDFYDYLRNHIMFIKRKLNWENKIIVFEHGANRYDSPTACGTGHAHLHILPFAEGILPDIMIEKEWIKCEWKKVADIVGDNEYLLYCEESEKGLDAQVYIHIVDIPESQYFRKVIFNKIGIEGSYSYKEDSRLEDSLKTLEMIISTQL